MAVANSLAYYDTATITTIKNIIVQPQGYRNKSIGGFKSAIGLK
jgi:hypothetical protein